MSEYGIPEFLDQEEFPLKPKKKKRERYKPSIHHIDQQCTHNFWIKRCSICKAILESDKQKNLEPGVKEKKIHDELTTLVCSFEVAKELSKIGLFQRSKLYWAHNPENGILALRIKSDDQPKDLSYVSAFTSVELVNQLYRLKVNKDKRFYEQIGRIAYSPDRLSKLLIRKLKVTQDGPESKIQ